ncbi:hypothetical protein CQ12_28780 [Bradyrhizobium jicamae]|uniref:Uncharacterized protein n=1 Tax=Bradyrhizobium jicamae TaxID=280332 RepID=A0A0R3M4I1_9BRAD|nr:hypothetical protein CQ12_28780 [Bradyrhizobium jicamae]
MADADCELASAMVMVAFYERMGSRQRFIQQGYGPCAYLEPTVVLAATVLALAVTEQRLRANFDHTF